MKISEIKTNGQVRKDLGDLTELKASMQSHGLLQPILVDKNHTVIAGHRRLQAAKELGWEEIDVIGLSLNAQEKMNTQELQLIENLHRKDLTPIEERDAYTAYMKETKTKPEALAKAIGKSLVYVLRRLKLSQLTEATNKALKEGKIELGHALLLCQLSELQQKKTLEAIKQTDMTVQVLRDQLAFVPGMDFQDMDFRSSNREQKTLLDSFDKELHPVHSGDLNREAVFKAEISKYIESKRIELKAKKITVFSKIEDLKKKHPLAEKVPGYDGRYNQIVAKLPDSKTHAVVVYLDYGRMTTDVYELNPKKELVAKTKQEKTEKSEKMLELDKKQVLANRISQYKYDTLVKINAEKLDPKGKMYQAIQAQFNLAYLECHSVEDLEQINIELKEYGIHLERYSQLVKLEKLTAMTKDKLENLNDMLVRMHIGHRDEKELQILTEAHKIFLEKDWKIDQAYLELHTKDQLADLVKELKIDLGPLATGMKKDELTQTILKEKLQGKVPKAMLGGK
jgi:ParB family transcriptional regulator, chromosome partitioning protein